MPKLRPEELESFQFAGVAMIWDEINRTWVKSYKTGYKGQKTVTFIDNTTFDADPTTQTSDKFFVGLFSQFLLLVDIVVTSTPTDILIEVQFSDDGEKWYKYMLGPFGDLRWEDSAGDKSECIPGKVLAPWMRIKVTCTGTSGSNKFRNLTRAILNG